jgi:iron complex outermembrane recepter protein
MFKKTIINQAILLCFGTLSGTAALAQETIQKVEITGSRIKSIGAVSNSPIMSVSEEELKAGQALAVEEVIRGLSSAVPAIGPGVNNGTAGGATIDLRGLGARRSLVLIDGRRFVPFDLNGIVDTNSIPTSLLRRIDIVTGGASAVYGADAIAGVANFILKKNFEGVEFSSSYGSSSESDSKRRRVDLTIGGNFADNKGNAVLSVGASKSDPLLVGQRPYGQTTTNSTNGLFSGSATTVPVVISVPQAAGIPAGSNQLGAGNVQLDPATGRFSALNTTTGTFNTNPDNYFQVPIDRRQLTALGRYTINDHAEVYAQLFYTRTDVNSALAATGTFGNSYTVPIGNPFIPDEARRQICSARGIPEASCVVGNTTPVTMVINRRLVELGPRFNDFENKTFQSTIGLRGTLLGNWTYDTYLITGEADQTQIRRNWGSNSKVAQSLNTTSTTACTNTANGCAPVNMFGAAGSISPEALKFINQSALLNAKVKQDVFSFSTTGDLGSFKSPWSSQAVGVALGLESRKVTASNQSDAASQIQGEVLGTGAPLPDRSGTIKLKEFYTEAQIPLVEKKPMAWRLGLEAGFRTTEFTTNSSQRYNTWKFGGEWAPIKSLRFRAMEQSATRAPNVNELFAPQVTGLSNLATDPCQGNRINSAEANTPGTLSNLCRLTGVPSTVIGSLPAPSSGQINRLTGGNPDLGPEKAKTTTVGFVWEPEQVKNLLISLDYYRIDLKDAISVPSTTDVLDQCYLASFNPGLTPNAACAAIFRSGLTGTFNGTDSRGVAVVQSNQGKNWTSGYDLTVSYLMKLSQIGVDPKWGKLDMNLSLNRVQDNDFQATPTSVRRECKGFYSNACGAPNWGTRFSQRTLWSFSNYQFSYTWRHVSAIEVEPGSGTFLPAFSKVPAYNYLDLAAVWQTTPNLKLTLTINNLTNKQPPVVGNNIASTATNGGNTFPAAYDTVGRYFTLGAALKF